MKTFNHYVFTRFNLGLYDSPYIDDPHPWMEHRMLLFEEFCLPSFERQTCRDFIWILAFDPATPDPILDKLYAITDRAYQARIMFEPHLTYFPARRHYWEKMPWVITSRFDNDDIADKHLIEAIQESFRERTMLIDIRYDILDLRTQHIRPMGKRRLPNSQFTSLVESTSGKAETVFRCEHSDLAEHYGGRIIPKILATRLKHDNNLLNFTQR